ncbi:MAG: hypothetical protein GEEBNDBF_01379 [bacterium]|nr:hypothetical protein [bacterium]
MKCFLLLVICCMVLVADVPHRAEASIMCPYESHGPALYMQTFLGTSPCGGGTGTYYVGGSWPDWIDHTIPGTSSVYKMRVRLHYCLYTSSGSPPCTVSPDHNQFNLDGQHCASNGSACGDLTQPTGCAGSVKWNVAKFCNPDDGEGGDGGWDRTDTDLIEIEVQHVSGTYNGAHVTALKNAIWSEMANGHLATCHVGTGSPWVRLMHTTGSTTGCAAPHCNGDYGSHYHN